MENEKNMVRKADTFASFDADCQHLCKDEDSLNVDVELSSDKSQLDSCVTLPSQEDTVHKSESIIGVSPESPLDLVCYVTLCICLYFLIHILIYAHQSATSFSLVY